MVERAVGWADGAVGWTVGWAVGAVGVVGLATGVASAEVWMGNPETEGAGHVHCAFFGSLPGRWPADYPARALTWTLGGWGATREDRQRWAAVACR